MASTIKQVTHYGDRRTLKYACGTTVPLGFVSLTENVMMVAMAGWMVWRTM